MHTILLVDDERIFHFLTTKIIEVSGVPCEMHSAYDGQEALNTLNEGLVFDIIFVDLDMPTMNGFQFIEAFKKREKSVDTKIVVLSSSITDDERRKATALGADVYMGKPLTETDVRSLLGA